MFLLVSAMTPISPLERYHLALEAEEFSADQIQAAAIGKLDLLYCHLLAKRPRQAWARLLGRAPRSPTVKGLYLWGGVGRGKTFVVDTFFACLPGKIGRRIHFHSFMHDIHRAL
ncbi:MAG: AFG1/ZapE family ATPase, partial [Burkholderiales bacterium]